MGSQPRSPEMKRTARMPAASRCARDRCANLAISDCRCTVRTTGEVTLEIAEDTSRPRSGSGGSATTGQRCPRVWSA